jgi:capsular exopolysaccharide synthesis family protein
MSRIDEAMKRAGITGAESIGTPMELDPAVSDAFVPSDTPTMALSESGLEDQSHGDDSIGGLFEPYRQRLDEKVAVHADSPPLAVEQYRRLAALLHHTQSDRGLRTVMVASAVAGEGKTLTAVNVALTLSESYRRRVLLIDADLRRPSVGGRFGLANLDGLSEALLAQEERKLAVVQMSDTLSVVPAGQPMADPMHVLTSNRMRRIIEEASQAFDWVIIDTPPVGLLTDANLLAAMVQAALVVIDAGRTPYTAVQRAIDAIGRDRILGVVLNRLDPDASPGGDYYHNYYTHYYSRAAGNGNGNGNGTGTGTGSHRRWVKRLLRK